MFRFKNKKETLTQLILLIVSSSVFLLYFKDAFLHLNEKLASTEGDSIKNYYTYVYHTVKDTSILHFGGMHYPYGEHFIYTDCQPLLTIILRFLPFTHNYLIGILHFLILFSFIITPNIIFKIFRLYNVELIASFCSALAIGLLTPQLQRIGGHFSLAYGCIIPLAFYLNLNYLKFPDVKKTILIAVYNLLIFFIHPYLGLTVSVLSLGLFTFGKRSGFLKNALRSLIPGALPLILFRVFMKVSDTHEGRTTEPFGLLDAVSTPASVFVPTFGPFDHFMKQIIPTGHREWEGISYIGIFTCFMLVVTMLLLILRKVKAERSLAILFVFSILLLFFSFGWQNSFFRSLGIDIGLLKQFRALGRFAWSFYFAAPIFCIIVLSKGFKENYVKARQLVPLITSALFLSLNFIEGHYYLKTHSENYLKSANVFNAEYLSSEEKDLVEEINRSAVKAILPVPMFYVGSEMFERDGNESAYLSMLLSYHCSKPLIAAMLSRTSINEAIKNIEILNHYKKQNTGVELIEKDSLAVIKISAERKPEEYRLLKSLQPAKSLHGKDLFYCTGADLKNRKNEHYTEYLLRRSKMKLDTGNIRYVSAALNPPFLPASIKDFNLLMEIPGKTVSPGNYVCSFHYHAMGKGHEWIDCNFIVEKTNNGEVTWEMMKPMRQMSGFYPEFFVFEQNFMLDSTSTYKFFLNGPSEKKYFVSDVLVRPLDSNVIIRNAGGKKLINNFPF